MIIFDNFDIATILKNGVFTFDEGAYTYTDSVYSVKVGEIYV